MARTSFQESQSEDDINAVQEFWGGTEMTFICDQDIIYLEGAGSSSTGTGYGIREVCKGGGGSHVEALHQRLLHQGGLHQGVLLLGDH